MLKSFKILERIREDSVEEIIKYKNNSFDLNFFLAFDDVLPSENDILKCSPPLISYAAYYGAFNCIKYMLENKVKTDGKDNFDRTIMHFAAASGNAELFQLLLDSGCSIEGRDKSSLTVLHYAARAGSESICALLWMDNDRMVTDNATEYKSQSGITPLHFAAESGNTECVDFFLANDCDPNIQTAEGNTCLHYAAAHANVLEMLIDNGADWHVRNVYGKTPFEVAMKKGGAEEGRFVLSKMIEAKEDCAGIFFAAAEACNMEIFDLFAEKGIDMNFENHLGETALHLAAKSGNIDFVNFLVENEGDPNWEDHNGISSFII